MTIEGGGASRAGLIERVKGILLSPKTEWDVIDNEPATVQGIFTGYVMILAAIPAIMTLLTSLVFASMLGSMGGMLGVSVGLSPLWAIVSAVISYVVGLVVIYVMALIIDGLAPSFGAVKGQIPALKVAAYSGTAIWVSSIALIIPILGGLVVLAGAVYTCYLIYLGLVRVMKTPHDKAVGYTVVVILLSIVAAGLIHLVANIPVGLARTSAIMAGAGPGVTLNLPGAKVNLNDLERAAKDMERAANSMEVAAAGGAVSVNTGASTASDVLQSLMPASLPGGFARTEVSGGGMAGVAMGAEAVYQRGASRIDLNVVNSGAMGALGAMAGAVQTNRTTATGYEKMGQVNGRLTTEEYDRSSNSGKYGVLVANRFMIEAEGDGVTIGDLKAAVEAIPFGRLEAMAKG